MTWIFDSLFSYCKNKPDGKYDKVESSSRKVDWIIILLHAIDRFNLGVFKRWIDYFERLNGKADEIVRASSGQPLLLYWKLFSFSFSLSFRLLNEGSISTFSLKLHSSINYKSLKRIGFNMNNKWNFCTFKYANLYVNVISTALYPMNMAESMI